MNVFKFRDGRVHVRNSWVKGLIRKALVIRLTFDFPLDRASYWLVGLELSPVNTINKKDLPRKCHFPPKNDKK